MDDGAGGRTHDPTTGTYQHANMIGTLRNESNATGSAGTLRISTACGEYVGGTAVHCKRDGVQG